MNETNRVLNVNINDIIPNRFQPRLNFEDNAMQELAKSIKEHGIIQPLVVRPIGDKFEIIAGERRYKAANMVALTTVPVIVANLDDTKSAEVALIENIQRKDLSAIEEAKSYQKILDMGNLTQEQLATRVGKSQSLIANKIRLLSLIKEVQDSLMQHEISERHARSLLGLSELEQKNMLSRIINERLTVRQTDQEVSNLKPKTNVETLDLFNSVETLDTEPNEEDIEKPITTIPETPVTPTIEKIDNLLDMEIPTIQEMPPRSELNPLQNDILLKREEELPTENNNNVIISNYKEATESIRNIVNQIKEKGIKADSEEFDFENFYQIIIKLDKK